MVKNLVYKTHISQYICGKGQHNGGNMKKKIILIIAIIIFIGLTFFIVLYNKKEYVEIKTNNACTISSFTLTDNGTEIEVKLNNESKSILNIDKIKVILYDSSNNKIKIINQNFNKVIDPNEDYALKINEKNNIHQQLKLNALCIH